jgi:hypothetical protein
MRMADVMYTPNYNKIAEDTQYQEHIKFQMTSCVKKALHLFILLF